MYIDHPMWAKPQGCYDNGRKLIGRTVRLAPGMLENMYMMSREEWKERHSVRKSVMKGNGGRWTFYVDIISGKA